MLLHLTQIGCNGAEVACGVASGEDVESSVNDVSLKLIDVGVTGAELAKRMWQ